MPTSTATSRTVELPSARVLVGLVYGVCVLGLVAGFAVSILVSDEDPYRSTGPIESIIAISVVGTTALVVGVGVALRMVRTPERARVGAFVLVGLAVLTIIFFWSGAPGIFGACAAWCAGLTKGARPLGGSARVAGIVGAFIAMLNVLLTIGGVLLSPLVG
jgi:hypothetical protein